MPDQDRYAGSRSGVISQDDVLSHQGGIDLIDETVQADGVVLLHLATGLEEERGQRGVYILNATPCPANRPGQFYIRTEGVGRRFQRGACSARATTASSSVKVPDRREAKQSANRLKVH